MKQLRWIWILGIAAVLLIGIFIVVDINSDKKEKAKHIGDAKQLLQIDTSKITHMSLKNEEGTFGFKWDDTNQTWVQTEGDPFNVNPYVISAIVNYASHLESIKTVAFDSKDKAVYGFNDPIEIRIFTTDTDDEHPYIINVGDNTPTYDAYYAMIGGSDEIYTIDYNSGTIFCSSKNAMKDAYLFNTTASQVSYIRVEKNGKTEFEIGRDSERAWQLLEPAGFSLAKAYVDELSDDIVHITVDSFVEDNPADLAKYGLDKPDRKVFLKGTDGTAQIQEEIWFGAPVSDHENETDLYGYFATSKQVFIIKKAETSFADRQFASLLLPYCADIAAENVESVEIDMGEVCDVKAALGINVTDSKYSFNGTDISGMYDDSINTLFMNFFRSIINLRFSETELDAKPDPDAEPVIKIIYNFNDGTRTALTFTKKNTNEFYLFTDGTYSGLTVRLNRFTASSCIVPCYDALVQALKEKQ